MRVVWVLIAAHAVVGTPVTTLDAVQAVKPDTAQVSPGKTQTGAPTGDSPAKEGEKAILEIPGAAPSETVEEISSKVNYVAPADKFQEKVSLMEPHMMDGPSDMPVLATDSKNANDTPFPVRLVGLESKQSSHSREKTIQAYVINLPEDQDRFVEFSQWWNQVWPELHINRVEGIRRSVQGQGILESFIGALKSAQASNVDVAMFFEDDAKPFETPMRMREETERLVSNWPEHSSVILLGGHHFDAHEKPNFDLHITQIGKAHGAYAWMIRREQIPDLLNVFESHLHESEGPYSCDVVWHKLWEWMPAYAATPLLVDHCPTGHSRTWEGHSPAAKPEFDPNFESKMLEHYKEFEGRSDWWNTPEWDPRYEL